MADDERLRTARLTHDNDGRPDLFVLGRPANRLYHQEMRRHLPGCHAAAGLPATTALARTAAFVDVDHDGDLDLSSSVDSPGLDTAADGRRRGAVSARLRAGAEPAPSQ